MSTNKSRTSVAYWENIERGVTVEAARYGYTEQVDLEKLVLFHN